MLIVNQTILILPLLYHVIKLSTTALRLERLQRVNRMPRQVIIVFVSARTHNLVTAKVSVLLLLCRQVALTLNGVQIAWTLPQLIVTVPISHGCPIIPQILQEHPPPALVKYLMLLAAHHEVPLLLVNCGILRVVRRQTHITIRGRAARSHLVVHAG